MEKSTSETTVTAQEYLDKLDKALDEYDKVIGLAKLKPPDDIDIVLTLSADAIKVLPVEQCRYIAYSLIMYSVFLKKEENRHFSKAKWADDQISMLSAKNINNYAGTSYKSYEEKKMCAVMENSFTSKLFKLRTQAYSRFNEIKDMSDKIMEAARYIRDIAYDKSKNNE